MISAAAPGSSPSFVPSPRQAFEGYVAINAPRPDVPVGALWIDGFGPTGDAASDDNLETVRSLNGVTIDKGLQLALTAGLFSLFGIEPRLRDRYTARFTDLTVVRVKDVSRLTGPKGEPRIVEAVKAASVVVSTEGEISLNARTMGWQPREVDGATANGRTRNYAIEGRDLFVAMRVATPKLISGRERELDVVRETANGASSRIGDYLIHIRTGDCTQLGGPQCSPVSYGVTKLTSYPASGPPDQVIPSGEEETSLPLPVPVADENGGLYDAVTVRWITPCAVRKVEHCRNRPRLIARFVGTRLEDFRSPKARGW